MDRNQHCFERAQHRSRVASIRPCAPFARSVARPLHRARDGPYFWDVEDKRLHRLHRRGADVLLAMGHPRVVQAVQSAAALD